MTGIKGMLRTKKHNKKISLALKGKLKSISTKNKISIKAKERLSIPENNPNYKGKNVGYEGIHIWLRKIYGLADKCDFCQKIGAFSNNKWNISYALIRGKKYERKRENFMKLCHKCHRNYDKTKKWNKNMSLARISKYKLLKITP